MSRYLSELGGWFSSTVRRKASQSLAIACESSSSLAARSMAPLNVIRSPPGRNAMPADHLNSHGTSKGSLGDLELAFDRFRDVLHERLAIKHKLGMLFFATLA